MKFNQWTLALASVGIVSLGSARADEQTPVTAAVATQISGYVDVSASWWSGKNSIGAAGNTGLPGRSFDGASKQDGFNLNVVKLALEKPLGEETTWTAGYKAELLFGPDATAYTTTLTPAGAAGGVNMDDFSIKQAYVALRAPVGNGLDIKLGVWDTIIGYEFFDSGSNANYSRSYGFALEPLHHTGALASYKVTDNVSIVGGIANSNTGPINDRNAIESRKSFLGAITVTLPEATGPLKDSVISAGVIHGRNGIATGGATAAQSVNNYYAGATLNTPIEGMTFGLAWDYLQDGAAPVGGSSDAYAVAAYVSYGQDKWKANLRADYTQATTGTYYASPGDRNELGSLTGTLDYNLWENVLTRLEVRYDRALSGDKPFGVTDDSALTVALNAVYKF